MRLSGTPIERFFVRAKPLASECWAWEGAIASTGYARMKVDGRAVNVHRWAYEMLVGPVLDQFELDHLCRNRWCVNPAHLEPVTHRENDMRGDAPTCRASRSDLCLAGHDLVEHGSTDPKTGRRRCRLCKNATERRRRHRRAVVAG